MSYDVGTHIDLTYLNKQKVVQATRPQQTPRAVYDTGTQIIFKYINGHFVTARKINVAFA